MTLDNIIQIAREVGFTIKVEDVDKFERFAALAQPSVKDTRDEEIALLREEIKRLRFCIPEGDAAAAMEYLAYCVEKAVAAEREACEQVCERRKSLYWMEFDKTGSDADRAAAIASEECSDAIRARGESK
jgi:hypothetical protein